MDIKDLRTRRPIALKWISSYETICGVIIETC